MHYNLIRIFVVINIALVVLGCSHNEIYRDKYSDFCEYSSTNHCEKNALQRFYPNSNEEFYLSFVEYDDQGQLRDPEQKNAVINQYYKLAAFDDVLVITFVHGWHHNAGPGDTNIRDFREKVLKKIAADEFRAAEQAGRPARKVLGVYVGWRGESIEIPGVNVLTFWDRKNTAHEVGQLGVTEFLLKLEELVNTKKKIGEDQKPNNSSKMVVVGHSFGGAVVFSSLQKILMERFIDSREDKNFSSDAKGFGDLVVLVNPAFEAIRFASLFDLSQAGCRKYFDTQLPKLAILTSEADWATGLAFPIGRTFSTFFESHKTVERHICLQPGRAGIKPFELKEGSADRTAVGHFEEYLTHDLIPDGDINTANLNYQLAQLHQVWAANQGEMKFAGSLLKSRGISTNLNPYLNVRVDKQLSGGHNDIWQPELVSFIKDLILISTIPKSAK